ncbi:serine protease [Listeria floridensis FSL S10-1187]|uniref:Serine protease n=1 Tax=Listeria floridensis FSL S10-1187 TaxID=1265817 RepID=A0ABP3B1C6_9LIST|nr:serine protease [Listeria floridensis FSL S10-1187]
MEKERNEFENTNEQQEAAKGAASEETIFKPHQEDPQMTPTAEGITEEGEKFAGATREQAEAGMSNAFFEESAEKEVVPKEDGTVPPVPPVVPPTRSSGGDGGGEPPKKKRRSKLFRLFSNRYSWRYCRSNYCFLYHRRFK